MATTTTFLKDPAATLDYKFDWKALSNGSGLSNWLAAGETIVSFTLELDAGLTVADSYISDAGTSVTVWLAGGVASRDYQVACNIITSAGRQDERTMTITVRAR
jgi:hypothetical protein